MAQRAQFTPAFVETSEALDHGLREIAINYEVRVDGSPPRALRGNPLDSTTLSWWRVLLNGLALFSLFVMLGLVFVGVVPRIWGWQPVVATTESMAPAIRSADVVLTSPSDGEGLGEGTIVHYERNAELHLGRIAAVTRDGYLTLGDAELVGLETGAVVEGEPVSADRIRGVGILVVPWIGLPVVWFQNNLWFKLASLGLFCSALVFVSRRTWVEPRSTWMLT